MIAAPVRPNGKAAAHSIEIATSAEAVWAILHDFARWGEWNPLYVRSAGRLVPGETIDFTVAVPGMKAMDARAVVYRVEQPRLIEYGLSSAGGLLRAFRYIDIAPTGPDGCRIDNGEIMSGPLGAIVRRVAGAKVALGLQRMNEALKARAEAATG